MKSTTLALAIAAALLIILCPWAPAQALQVAHVGDHVPNFSFEKIAAADDGSTSMKQWLGQPVLFEFWGTR